LLKVSTTINTIKTIVLIMATTITIEVKTKERLADYKYGDMTYDDLLNMLMDKVAIEDISVEHIKEHYRRLDDFKGLSKKEFEKRLRKKLRTSS
jgi:hypothetical protein